MDTLTAVCLGIGAFAYATFLFLSLRDLRIFRRTGYASYRKGAFKGIIASTIVLISVLLMQAFPLASMGLVVLALTVNQKGKREPVFTTAKALDRFLGKTDIVRTREEIYEEYLKQKAEKESLEKQEEKNNSKKNKK